MDASAPHLGLIAPFTEARVPSVGVRLYGSRVRFTTRGLALDQLSPSSFDAGVDWVLARARSLAESGVQAVLLTGASLSFYRGTGFNRALCESMGRVTQLPCTTVSEAMVRALRHLGVQHVALVTVYSDDLNRRLDRFLRDSGFTPTALRGLAITDPKALTEVPFRTMVELCLQAYQAQPGAEGIVLSCGGPHLLDVVAEVESSLGVPVVPTVAAGFWDLMRCAGLNPNAPGRGRLFEAAAGSP